VTSLGRRYLFLAPFSWRFGAEPRTGGAFVVCRVDDGPADVNTILLDCDALTDKEYWHLDVGGAVLGHGHHAGRAYADLLVSEELARLVPGDTLVPLLVASDTGEAIRLFAQVRIGRQDVLAIWCGEWTDASLPTEPGPRLARMLLQGLQHIEANRYLLSNHQYHIVNLKPGTEIEHKLTITSAVDIYKLTAHFHDLLGQAPLTDYVGEYGNEFEQHDFDNHLYEVVGPPEETGYISFIPNGYGGTVVKRKWFTQDAVERRESVYGGVRITVPGSEYIRDRFDVASRYLGVFRRTRFDVNMESVVSGNIYAIMVDRCCFAGAGWPDLCQVEIEYLRSRTIRASALDALEYEMRELVDAGKSELDRLGIGYVESPLSKLTYMRQRREEAAA
jgi:hypothetical protein